jgi:hypothetical protein
MRWKTLAIWALLCAGGMAVYRNWEAIEEMLGLESISLRNLRAVDLAKSANTLDRYQANSAVIRNRLQESTGRIVADDWKGERRTPRLYLVSFTFTEDGIADGYWFEVDLETLEVRNVRGDHKLEVLYGIPPAAPR